MLAIPELDSGGPDRVFFELLSNLPRDRFRVSLVVGQGGGRYYNRLPSDVEVVHLGSGRYPLLRLALAVRQRRPHVVLATLRMAFSAGLVRQLLPPEVGLVLRPANAFTADFTALKRQSMMKHRMAERLTMRSLRQADALVCQSTSMANDLRGALRKHPPLIVIGNPIDVQASADAAARDRVDLAGTPRLLAVGRLAHQKGFDLLIKAMPEILLHHPGALLTLLGGGEDAEALRNIASTLGVKNSVRFGGVVENPLAYMRRADLLISSSRYEGFPNIVLEAMAVGCPVVATDCPGASRDLVREGDTGWLAAPENPAAIAAAVNRAFRADRDAVAERARSRCIAEYNMHHIAEEYARVLASVADRRRHGG